MPEQSTASRTGLFTTADTPIPLAGVSIDAEISTLCARVVVTQRYVNTESKPIEAVYLFPLDEGAAVCGFEAIVDGTLVVGEIKPREEAFRMYDDAMEKGHGAYLLDEERPDVFQASVGNLPPGKEILLKLTYVTELTVDGSSLRFSIPTTVSPRYAPAEDRVGVGRPDSQTLNPPLAWRVPYGLDLSVRVTMAAAITRVESPSHPVSVSLNGSVATVTLAQRDAALDRDFVLSVDASALDVPQAWMERDDDGTESVAVAFIPAFRDAAAPSEVIFLVDRSGSMGGTSIAEVRNALQLCLRSMIPGCHFNIFGFGSTFDHLFPASLAYDERSLARASEHVAALDADLGGTEILPALQAVLDQPRAGALTRQIVVLTDGQVTNTDAVLALAEKRAADTGIFTFGIGASASHHLVRGLARAGGGVAELIHPGERIEPKVVRQFGRLLSPALTNVNIKWDGFDVTQAPSVIPPVVSGGRLLLYGFLKTPIRERQPRRAQLTADAPSGPMAFDVEIDPAKSVAGRTVATLAARARIRELEESAEWLATRGSRQSVRKVIATAHEIIALSTRYTLISRETSFVAIERRDTPVHGDIQLRRIPIALSAGWGGLEAIPPLPIVRSRGIERCLGGAGSAPALLRFSASLDGSGPSSGYGSMADPGGAADADAFYARTVERTTRSVVRHAPSQYARSTDASAPPAMHVLVRLQHADGSWDLTRELAKALGYKLTALEAALSSATGDKEDIRKAWATALALAWLRHHAREAESEWEMLAAKARKWLDDAPATFACGTAWMEAATTFLRS
jgi:hypothetical protein